MTTKPISLTDLTTAQIQELVTSLGEPAYRAHQLQRRIYQGLAVAFDEMTDLPKTFREKLAEKTRLHSLIPTHEETARDGTVKTLFSLSDKKTIETALMAYPTPKGGTRYTLCVSTQVGCPIGCAFCATGQQGFERNLTPGEIIDQVLYFARMLRDWNQIAERTGQPVAQINNIVFMGMGEPMLNYDALWQAIEMLNSPDGFGLGARNMTVSTSGLIPEIKRLSGEKLQVGLAISLHAATDELRGQLVPINRKYSIKPLIAACKKYFEKTGRRLSFEYILFEGINDSPKDARALAHVVQGLNCHVNLIPANPTRERQYRPPTQETVLAFEAELKRLRINCTVRSRKGVDIDAGCGQLRSRLLKPAPLPRKGKS